MDCCKLRPNDRLTFKAIAAKYNESYFTQVLKGIDITETLIQNIWDEALLECKATKDIEFKKFHEFLIGYFRLKNPEEKHYLKQALKLPFLLKTEADPPYMTRDNFGHVGRLFKFTKKKDNDFIKRVVEVFKADWFYGSIDRVECEKQLKALADKNKNSTPINCIVRYANSRQLCLTYQKKDNVFEHCCIEPADAMSAGGYAKFVTNYYSSKILKHELVSSLRKSFSPYTSPNKKKK